MAYWIRVFGWLLLGMCSVLALVGVASFLGMSLDIDFFGRDLSSVRVRVVWVVANGILALVGLGAIRWSHGPRRS